jgi:hypothetical protein
MFKVLNSIAFGISTIPYIWIIGIIAFAVRAREYLGYWPRPSHPDPKNLPSSFEPYHAFLWDIFICLKWSLLIVPLYFFASHFLTKLKLTRMPLKIYLVGWTFIIAMIVLPKIDFVMWFMD